MSPPERRVVLTSFIRIGHRPTDSLRDRRIKTTFVLAIAGAALFPLGLILTEDRSPLVLSLDCGYLVAMLAALATLQLSGRVDWAYMMVAAATQAILLALLLIVGNANGDLFIVPVVPIFAVVLLGARRSLPWFAASLAIVVLAGLGDSLLPELATSLHSSAANPAGLLFHGPAKVPVTQEMVFAALVGLILTYLVVRAAYHALEQANERIEGLLLNVLPSSVAARLTDESQQKLQRDGAGIADEYSEATILFADIVGFTDLAANRSAAEVMAILDTVFTDFDRLAERHRVEKIKTIGDAYMAVCGLPEPDPEHAVRIAEMALDMMAAIDAYRDRSGTDLRLRIGIASGPVIAGIIGRKKFIYDLWGDAVNVASRMESHGAPDTIQVSAGAQAALAPRYDFEALGPIQIKGKGPLPAWRLLGRKAR